MKRQKKLFLFIPIYSAIASILICKSFGYSLLSGITVLESGQEVTVLEIRSDTPAKNAGVKKGDIIFEIDGKKIVGMDDYVKYSRTLSDKRHETLIRVKRNGRILDLLIEDYSIPIKKFWDEKAPFSREKIPGKEDPFDYWIDHGKRRLDSVRDDMPYQQKIETYRKAIDNLYYALNYNPKMVMAMILIADTYKKMGETSIKNRLAEEAVENFRISVRLYKKAMAKTDLPRENLIEIRENLKTIEGLLKPAPE